ncbi:hypothetical protein RHOSPDRAFT_33767 [Rhodotorula sp. JG-1b]|nr:hypothetical protein RHOSPDRAFT_33767 [Rhodotorula sp. JG-1b]
MLPLGLPARPPTFHLRQTLSVHDFDGADRSWVVESAVAKISICAVPSPLPTIESALTPPPIVNSQNLTLHLRGRILTSTVEVFSCRNVRLNIGPRPEEDKSADEVQPLGTLQLDPPLENVTIEYAAPQYVGKMVLAPLVTQDAAGRPTFATGHCISRLLLLASGRSQSLRGWEASTWRGNLSSATTKSKAGE